MEATVWQMIAVGICCVIGSAAWAYLSNLFSTKRWLQSSAIPGPPAPNWLIGHVSTLLSDLSPVEFANWTNKYGPIYKLQMNASPAVVLTDPQAICSLIRWGSSPSYITKTPAMYAALELGTKPQIHNLLTSADNAYWRAVRQGVAPCFSISNLKQVFHNTVLQLCEKAVSNIKAAADAAPTDTAAAPGTAYMDAADLAKRFTSDIMGRLLFDEDLGAMNMGQSEYLDVFSSLLEEVHKNFANPLRRFTPTFVSSDLAKGREALDIHDKLMDMKLGALLASPPPDTSITGHLLKVIDPATGQPLSQAQLKAEMAIMMGAGYETTSHAISWTLGCLAVHPEVQETLAAELAGAGYAPSHKAAAAAAGADDGIDSSGSSSPRLISWSDLSRLPYLNAVLKEGLRLFSPASLGTLRVCHKEVEVMGHRLPKGTWVIMSPYCVSVSTHNYGPTAEHFIPERWLETTQLLQLHQLKAAAAAGAGSYNTGPKVQYERLDDQPQQDQAPSISNGTNGNAVDGDKAATTTAGGAGGGEKLPDPFTFSLGPRDCIGQALAKIEMQALVATIVSNFKLEPSRQLADELAAAAAAEAAAKASGARTGDVPGFNPTEVLKRCIMYHVTLQPKDGMWLRFTPRA